MQASNKLQASNKFDFYGIVGHVKNKEERDLIIKKCLQKDFLVENKKESDAILEEICQVIETKTGNDKFDAYCKQTYLDNVLRGGFPIQIASNKVFYVYGRKHGDIERDYNFFQMQPEYYSQGNGNFRDINQNRRCDVAFFPFVGDKNIKTFYNLTQWDGYNPLLIQKTYFQVEDDTFSFLKNKPFSPGSLYAYLEEELDDDKDLIEKQFAQIMEVAVEKQEAEHGEGFWTDHWTYQLDLVEEYLTIFPEKKEALLFEDRTYTCHQGEAYVQPRKKRYVVTERGVRQMHAVKEEKAEILMEEYYFSLFELLLLQVVTKYSCLDPYGLGMEMEAGKPGWYDALNGLPALFGSSMPETLELERLIAFLLDQMTDSERNIKIPGILFLFIKTIVAHDIPLNRNDSRARFSYWNSVNNAKEAYREQLRKGSVGECFNVSMEEIKSWLVAWKGDVEAGTTEAIRLGNGICPTYFYYELSEYEVVGEEILPKQFLRKQMPLFLEGPVRYLKLAKSKQDKQAMYQKVKRSPLYDQKLKMYKVNESLEGNSYEIGRAKAFTPGWLENESIWLHMEYKYLLELLKSKLYTEFFEAFEQAVIPFLDEETYGRSILENSSFIVSSANENEKLHGRGFVARLSGSTIEFLNMWLIMMFGKTPFQMIDGRFTLTFAPAIPSYLIKEETQIKATFLGDITVCFNVEGLKALIPGCYSITSYTLFYKNGTVKEIEGTTLFENEAYDVREKRISKIEVKISSL